MKLVRRSRGFTLPELMTVLVIAAILLAIAVPALIGVAALGELAFAFWLLIKNPNGVVASRDKDGAGVRIGAAA